MWPLSEKEKVSHVPDENKGKVLANMQKMLGKAITPRVSGGAFCRPLDPLVIFLIFKEHRKWIVPASELSVLLYKNQYSTHFRDGLGLNLRG